MGSSIGIDGVRPSALPEKYGCSSDKLHKKGLLGAAVPTVEDLNLDGVDQKTVNKYWPKAWFTFEMRAHGELSVSAAVKGIEMWGGALRLDELLKKRANGESYITHEGVQIALDPLLELVDAKLYGKMDKKKSFEKTRTK